MNAKHVISHRHSPRIWQEGFPIGNGELGAMFWGDDNPLSLTIDRSDLWDLRGNIDYLQQPDFNYAKLVELVDKKDWKRIDEVFEQRQLRDNPVTPTKISIGRMEISIEGAVDMECSLDIDRGLVSGVLYTENGEKHPFRCFIHKTMNVLCLHLSEPVEGVSAQMQPLADLCPDFAGLQHPKPIVTSENGINCLYQQIPDGIAYCLAWTMSGQDFIMAVESGDTVDSSKAKAEMTLQAALDTGFNALEASHITAWQSFWSASAVHLPEADIELLWYYGIYLLASSAKKNGIPPGLQGLWAMDGVVPPWRGDYHADMNVQETFWPACASGHLDLLDCWCDYMKKCIPAAEDFTGKFFGTEGTFWLACTIPYYTPVPCWHTVHFAWSHSGWLGWLVWLRWRYSMDVNWLRETGYPIIAGIFRFYSANLAEEDDGMLHIPVSSSPEYKENLPQAWCKDPNVDIALIRRCCSWIVEMEEALGMTDFSDRAAEILSKLRPYSLDTDNSLCLWPGKALDESHRHPSQLMAIHPAMDMTIDGDEDQINIINASIEHFMKLGQYMWGGHTYAQMISFAAVTGRSGMAYDFLRQYYQHWIAVNGLYYNRDLTNSGMSIFRIGEADMNAAPFTMESSNAVSAGISDMLLQGWNDVVRVFPSVPDNWPDVAFEDLLTEGAFRVSAVRKDKKTVWVRVTAGADRTLNLKNPFGDSEVEVVGAEVVFDGRSYSLRMKTGQTITFCASGYELNTQETLSRIENTNLSRLGIK